MYTLSPKQIETIKESTAKINLWTGPVRSGKSFSSFIKWLEYIQHGPPIGDLVMCGKTQDSIKRNIVSPLCDLVGLDLRYYAGKREINLWGKKIELVGCNDSRAEEKIRGMTAAGIYMDEVTLLPQSFFMMALSRLSPDGSKLFGTSNPDSPYHWLKTEFIDQAEKKNVKNFVFDLEDNPSLSEQFKKDLKSQFSGLWYKRFIEGEWCLAEGTIYDFFDEKIHVIDLPPQNAKEYVIAVDYGTTNACAFGLFGYNNEAYPNVWLEDEYYWDSRKELRQKTDSEYAHDLKKFIGDKIVQAVIIDPSAASFKAECNYQSIDNIMDADNDVLNGIRFTSNMLGNGTFKITRKCQNMLKEMQTYVWDEASIKLGIDKPLKQNDHMCDVIRYGMQTYFRPIYEGGDSMDLSEYRRRKAEANMGWG